MRTWISLLQWEIDQMWRGVRLNLLLPLIVVLVALTTYRGSAQFFDVMLPQNTIPFLWQNEISATALLGLLTTIVISEFTVRDHLDRVDETLATLPFPTPLLTIARIIPVMLAALLIGFVYSLVTFLVQVVFHLAGSTDFPQIWIGRYLILWVIIIAPAMLSAAAIGFCATVFLQNRRIVLYPFAFLFWLLSFLPIVTETWADPAGYHFYNNTVSQFYSQAEHSISGSVGGPGGQPIPVVSFTLQGVQAQIVNALNVWPPLHDFLVTRLFYVIASIVLFLISIGFAQRSYSD